MFLHIKTKFYTNIHSTLDLLTRSLYFCGHKDSPKKDDKLIITVPVKVSIWLNSEMWGKKEECQLSLKLLIKNTTAKTDTGLKSFKDYVFRPSNNSKVCYTTDIKYTFPEIIFLATMVYITKGRSKDLCRA